VWKGEYDPFGKVTETVSTVEQNLRFPGQYFDGETGLHYNYFRTYDPSLGRYIQADPRGILLDYSDPQRQVAAQMGVGIPSVPEGYLNHRYGYVDQNPLAYADPYGEYVVEILQKLYKKIPVKIDGYKKSKDGFRLCQVRYKNKPVFRIDKHPISPTDRTPRWHYHIAPDIKKHRGL